MLTRTKVISVFLMGMIAVLITIALFAFRDRAEGDNTERLSNAVGTPFYAPKLPEQMSFAGEKVPLDRPDVREMFDRELIYNVYSQGHILYLLKLSKLYFPGIEATLKREGVPDDFKYLCVAESNLQAATSKVGAQGYWQFMSGTAPGYNMEVSASVDERNHLEKSTLAACKYLKQAYAKFGTWTAAAASYNCGMGGYNSQATFQQTKDYYNLQLPTETNKYIFRILTFKHIMSNPEYFGFQLSDKDLYRQPKLRKIAVTQNIPNLAQWALDNGTSYKLVKYYNPWLVSRSLVVKAGKTYEIQVP